MRAVGCRFAAAIQPCHCWLSLLVTSGGFRKARFRRPVVPGDQIILKAKLMRSLKGIWKFDTVAEVDNREVASAEMMVAPEANGERK